MKNNGYIFETDSFRIKLYTKQETCEMFGLDYLEDYGHTIPEDLLNRYLKNEKERLEIQTELQKIMGAKK